MMNRRRNRLTFGDFLGLGFFVLFIGASIFIFWRTNIADDEAELTPPVTSVIEQANTPTANTLSQVAVADLSQLTGSRIQIPAAGINAMIVPVYLDGTSWDVSQLGMNVGHLEGTAWMSSSPGNIVLSGHVELSDGRRGIFARIGDLSDGDIVILGDGEEERRYSVTRIEKVEPTDLSPVYPTTEDRLTLITCDDYSFFQDSYKSRVIVVANRIS